MSLLKPAMIGLGVGAAYGTAWATLALLTGYEYRVLTAGFGAAVGAAVSISAGREAGNRAGLLAVLATLGTALAARLIVVDRFLVEDRAAVSEAVREISDDEAMVHIACTVAMEAEDDGRTLAWPMGITAETADEPIDFPPEIWSAAVSRWRGLMPEDQDRVREIIRDLIEAGLAGSRGEELDAAFTGSLHREAVAALIVACILAFFLGRTRWDESGSVSEVDEDGPEGSGDLGSEEAPDARVAKF